MLAIVQHLFLHVVSGLICSMHLLLELGLCNCSCVLKGLLNKRPGDRLGWPGLLDHPFVRESIQERTKREAALADAVLTAQESRAWKGEGGAIAGHQHSFMPLCLQSTIQDSHAYIAGTSRRLNAWPEPVEAHDYRAAHQSHSISSQ